MQGTEHFQKTILSHLQGIADSDPNFKIKFQNPEKSIEDCIIYILNTVQKSGCNGFHDDEIYGMAVHYYDEEMIEIGKPIQAKVVINHSMDKPKDKAPKKTRVTQSKTEPFEQLSMF